MADVAPSPLTNDHVELQVGIGTAGDWIAWASRLRGLDFKTSIKRASPRAKSYLELTRFTYAWTAANALFARDEIMRRICGARIPSSELARFRCVYDFASVPAADVNAYLIPMQQTLELTRVPRDFPWAPLATVRVIDLIYHKYTPSAYRARGDSARAIRDVVLNGHPVTGLDLPTLLYSTRNWTVHGSLLDSSFRGAPQQYQLYAITATRAVADILGRFASAFRAII